MSRVRMLTVAVLIYSGSAQAAENCAALVVKLQTLDMTAGSAVVNSKVGKTYQKFYSDCDQNDLFNGKALPSLSNGHQLKCSTDPNHVSFISKFPDGTIVFKSKLGVDADGSPVSQSADASPADQPHTSLTYDMHPTEFVNAEDVSFVVVPGSSTRYKASMKADTGIGLGDLAVVIANGRCSFGLVADEGPAYRIGEASMKTHEDLGNPQCKTANQHPCRKLKAGGNGVGIAASVTTIIFPGSRPNNLASATITSVTAEKGNEKISSFLNKFQH